MLKGHFKKAGVAARDTASSNISETSTRQVRNVDIFENHASMWLASKGEIQGVVKTSWFSVHRINTRTRGVKNRGSIGIFYLKVLKGKMADQMGNERVTVQNLQVIKVFGTQPSFIEGSVPGAKVQS